jgi:hypothetical protein
MDGLDEGRKMREGYMCGLMKAGSQCQIGLSFITPESLEFFRC